MKAARLDIRLSENEKDFFYKAFEVSGFSSFSEFVIQAVKKEASKVIIDHERILSSEKDMQIFFQALMNPALPNEELRKAFELHRGFEKLSQ